MEDNCCFGWLIKKEPLPTPIEKHPLMKPTTEAPQTKTPLVEKYANLFIEKTITYNTTQNCGNLADLIATVKNAQMYNIKPNTLGLVAARQTSRPDNIHLFSSLVVSCIKKHLKKVPSPLTRISLELNDTKPTNDNAIIEENKKREQALNTTIRLNQSSHLATLLELTSTNGSNKNTAEQELWNLALVISCIYKENQLWQDMVNLVYKK